MEHIDYTIGDDIVALHNHSRNLFKEGSAYIAKGLKETECNCPNKLVNIGVKSRAPVGHRLICVECGTTYISDGIYWFYANSFKKLDNLVNISELTEILEKEAFNV